MLEHTFLHIPGVGFTTERSLWHQGILTWTDALGEDGPPAGFSQGRWDLCRRALEESSRCLAARDHFHFAGCLPAREQWRAYSHFHPRTAYLDIETTGLGHYHEVTVVGLYDGVRTATFLAGDNLDQLPEALEEYSLLVTFNGASFDLPFLERRFPGLVFDQLHVDLRYPLRRLGLSGGLKSIERRVGLEREPEVAGLDGWDAVRLWHEYQAGNEASLETLIKYNTADIENLEHLMQLVYVRLRRQTGLPTDTPDTGEGGQHGR